MSQDEGRIRSGVNATALQDRSAGAPAAALAHAFPRGQSPLAGQRHDPVATIGEAARR
jgi:hypothetical protein